MTAAAASGVTGRLSFTDRYLAVWILAAMAAGLGLGRLVPGLGHALAAVEIGGISLPIAAGLLVMMYPVLAFGLLGWFSLGLLPGWLGLGDGRALGVSPWRIAANVAVFLGVPLAAGFLTRRVGGAVGVRSAGSQPAETVNPAVVEAMAEAGVDISAEIPKVLTVEAVRASDVCVTMGCGDTCPVFPGKRYLDWALPDPAGQGVEAVRPIRDEIERRVRSLLADLGVEAVA